MLYGSLYLPLLVLFGADLLEWKVRGTSIPWTALTLFIATIFVLAGAFQRGTLRLAPPYRLALAFYLVAVYGVGLYYLTQAGIGPLKLGDLSESGLRESALEALNYRRIAVQIVFLLFTPLIALAIILITDLWRLWLVWCDPPHATDAIVAASTIVAFVFLTEVFAFYTAFSTGESVAALEYYTWHHRPSIGNPRCRSHRSAAVSGYFFTRFSSSCP